MKIWPIMAPLGLMLVYLLLMAILTYIEPAVALPGTSRAFLTLAITVGFGQLLVWACLRTD